jgi:hypothetical protein
MVQYFVSELNVYSVLNNHTCWLGEASGDWYRVKGLPSKALAISTYEMLAILAELAEADDLYTPKKIGEILSHEPSGNDPSEPSE